MIILTIVADGPLYGFPSCFSKCREAVVQAKISALNRAPGHAGVVPRGDRPPDAPLAERRVVAHVVRRSHRVGCQEEEEAQRGE